MSFLKEKSDSSISKFSKEVRELSRSVLCRGWTGFPKIIKKKCSNQTILRLVEMATYLNMKEMPIWLQSL